MRRALPAVAAATLIGGTVVLAFLSGGYFDQPRIGAAIVAWALVALAAIFGRQPLPRSTAGRVALAGLVGLCAWTALSISWAPLAGRAEDDLQRLLLYLGAFLAGMAWFRDAQVRRWIEPAVAFGVLVVILYGLSERLVPGLIELDRSRTSSGRLEQPVTYWNALGILAVVGLLLAVRVAGDPDRPRALRGAAAAAGVPIALGVYLSFARGALAAFAVGLLVVVALTPAIRLQLRAIVAVLGPGTLVALVASRLPTIESLPLHTQGDTGDGLIMLAALLVGMAAAPTIALSSSRRRLPAPRLPASRAVTVLTASVLVTLAGGVVVAAFEGKPDSVSPVQGADPRRLASIDTNRYRYWDVALREFAQHPVTGLGSGGFSVEWLKERDRVDRASDAHSLYIETLSELGVVGLVLLLLFGGGVAAAFVRLHRQDPAAATGATAAFAAWAVHAGLDWDWEVPAATLPALLLAAAAIAWSEEPRERPDSQVAEPGRPAESPAMIC
jgi:O-antigen ligase